MLASEFINSAEPDTAHALRLFHFFSTRVATNRFPRDTNAAKKNTHAGPSPVQISPHSCAAPMDTTWSSEIPVESAGVISSGETAMERRYTD